MNHSPMKITAGMRAVNQMMNSGTKVRMRDPGKNTMYAPRTPEIAPLAPTEGIREPHENNTCETPDPIPQTK
jgi:hypothetical protein